MYIQIIGGEKVLTRKIIRMITPGTLGENNLSDSCNYLMCVSFYRTNINNNNINNTNNGNDSTDADIDTGIGIVLYIYTNIYIYSHQQYIYIYIHKKTEK